MAPLHTLRAAALFCVLLITGVACIGVTGIDANSDVIVQTTPAQPLLDVVFLATTSLDPDRTLYISSTSNCGSRISPICTQGHTQVGVNYNSSTCIFNVTSASLGLNAATTSLIPALHWCSSATGSTFFATLHMNVVRMTPAYAYYSTVTTFTFNLATPVGTTVGLYTESSCFKLLGGLSLTTLESSRELTADIGPRTVTYVCASIPTVFNSVTVMAVRSVVYGVSPYDIYTTQGIRHRNVAISSSTSFHYMSLSTDPQCLTLAQPYQQTGTGEALLTVKVPRGSYYFCGVIIRGLEGVGVFVPARSTFEVLEYGLQPHTMYAEHATPMSFSLDAVAGQSELQGALFTTADCGVASGTPVTSWSTSMTWTVELPGTYYACVRTRGSTLAAEVGYVNEVVISNIPAVSLARQPAIMGLGELATVTRSAIDDVPAAVVTVGLSASSSCTTLFAGGNTTEMGSTAPFYVPESSPSTIYYCVSNRLTTDASGGNSSESTVAVYYPLGLLELRTYGLSYPPLRTNTTMEVGLDTDVTFDDNTSICLTPALLPSSSNDATSSSLIEDDACDAAIAASNDRAITFHLSSLTFQLSPVSFSVAGSWLLCVREPRVMGSAYMRLRTLRVYGNATVTPGGVIRGIPARLDVAAIPPSTAVSLTTDSDCSAGMPVVTTTQSSLIGTASLLFTYPTIGNLLLCVGYRGEHMSQGTAAQLMVAGTVASTDVRVVPSLAVDSVLTQLTFSAPGASLLRGHTALLVPPNADGRSPTTCPTSATAEHIQLPISVPPSSTAGEIAVASFTPASSTVGTAYLVCVGQAGAFVPTGALTVATAPTVTADPSPLAFGLPAYVFFSSAIMSLSQADTFTVIKVTDSCTSDLSVATVLATGSIIPSTGAAQPFLVPSLSSAVTSVRLCVAQRSQLVDKTLGYADAGAIALITFTSVTRYAQRQRPNILVGTPLLSTATLYLTSCTSVGCAASNADATCSSAHATKYTTSSDSLLTAPVGTYFLCQQVTWGTVTSVVGSNTTVEVVEPFGMTLSVDPSDIRAYVPFGVTMSGGPGGASAGRADYRLTVQPASVPCAESAAESQSFVVGGGTTELTITDIAPVQRIHFCVRPSPVDAFEVLTGTLRHYMAPAAVVGDRATTLTSGGVTGGATAVLSRTADCLGGVAGGGATPIVDGRATFTVASCGANAALTSLYYCEAADGGAYASRGAVGLLRASGCDGGAGASIAAVDAAPGAAIGRFGIDAAYLARPRLSASPDCGVLLDAAVASVGYAPGAGERAAFHVCAVLVGDASVTFTTAQPTLHVANWAVSPTAAVSRYNATLGVAGAGAVRVDYATPSSETFFSTARDCSVRTASAAGLSGASKTAAYRTTGVRGLVYVCTVAPLSGETLAVAQFLSVTPPAVRRVSPAVVRGAEYSATLVVDGAPPLYSMVPGADSGYAHSGYYTSASREVYMSGDACASALAGTSAATVTPSGSVSFATAGIAASVRTVSLCAVTAGGPAVVLAGVVVAPGRVHPTTLVSGALGAPVFIPSLGGVTVQLSASASGCGSAAGMPSFTTDVEGYGTVDLVGGDGGALAPGTYTLCYDGALRGGGGAAATALESVVLVRASYFDVRGTTFVVGVAGRMLLQQDLTAAALVPGFSTVRSCTSVSSEHGAWAAVTSTSVSVTATSEYRAGLYLCARAPVNGTLVAVPGAWAGQRSVRFAASAIQLPSAGWDACTTYTLDRCYPPGASASSATSVLAVVRGDCCGASRTSAVVGEASMASGTCELTLDYDKVSAYPAGSTYHVCVWDSADDTVCTTVSEALVSTNCTRGGGAGRGLSRGAVAGVVVACVVGGGVVVMVLFAVWFFCLYGRPAAAGDASEDCRKGGVAVLADSVTRSFRFSPTGDWSTGVSTPDERAFPEEGHELGDELEECGESGPVFGDHPVMRRDMRKPDSSLGIADTLDEVATTGNPIARLTMKHVEELVKWSDTWRPSALQLVEMWLCAVKPVLAEEALQSYAVPPGEPSILSLHHALSLETELTVVLNSPQQLRSAAVAKPPLHRSPTPMPRSQQRGQVQLQQLSQQGCPVEAQRWSPLIPPPQCSLPTHSQEFLLSVVSRELTPEDKALWVLSEDGGDSEGSVMRGLNRCPCGTAAPLMPVGLTARHLEEVRERSHRMPCLYREEMRQWLEGAMAVPEARAYMASLAAKADSNPPSSPSAPPQGPASRAVSPLVVVNQKCVSFGKSRTMPTSLRIAPGTARAIVPSAAPPVSAQAQAWPLPEARNSSLRSRFDYARVPTLIRSASVSFGVSFDTNGALRLPQCVPATAATDSALLEQKQSAPQLPDLPSPSSEWPPMYTWYELASIGPAVTGNMDSSSINHGNWQSSGVSGPLPSCGDAADGFHRYESQWQQFL